MTVTGSRLSPVSDVVREAYGIALGPLAPLAGGYQNEVWRAGEVVVRVERAAPESIAWEHRLVRFFSDRLEEVAAPLEAADGSTFFEEAGRIVSVWPYVDGRPARRRHEPHAVAAAELLARLHRAGCDWNGGQRPGASPLEGEGERGPIHGDFYRGNVLMWRGRIVGLVDWEESCVNLLGYDLANAVWEFGVSKKTSDFDRALASAMLEAYGSEFVPDDLIPLIVTRLRWELDVWHSEGDNPYRRHLLRSIAKLGG